MTNVLSTIVQFDKPQAPGGSLSLRTRNLNLHRQADPT